MTKWFQFFFVLFFTCSSYAEQKKLQVCSVTINSSEEIETFKEHLNPEKFEFIELVPQEDIFSRLVGASEETDTEPSSWFEEACEKDIQCDVLVISGHFGGSFIGESGYFLSLQEMEKLSCQTKCENVLSHLKEVFLFGCNTLAGKTQDNRTPEEYLEALLEHSISPAIAERVTATRYSGLNNSFQKKMRLIFSFPDGQALLYGFHSIGPSGSSVKHLLEDYFKKIKEAKGSYYEHLSEIDKELFPNKSWSEALRITSQTQALSFTSHDKEYETYRKVCGFHTNSDDILNMKLAEELLRSGEGAFWLSYISDFIGEGEFEGEALRIFHQLREDESLSHDFTRIYRASFSTDLGGIYLPFYMFNYLRFLRVMNWIDQMEYKEEFLTIIRPLVLEGSDESYDTLISLNYELERNNETFGIEDLDISFEELPEDYFSREKAFHIMGFIQVKDEKIHRKLAGGLRDENAEAHYGAIFSLLRSEVSDKDVLKQLIDTIMEDPAGRLLMSSVIKAGKIFDSHIVNLISEKLDDEDPSVQDRALLLLGQLDVSDPVIQKAMAEKLKGENPLFIQETALESLAQLTSPLDPVVQKAMAEKLEDENSYSIQETALQALSQLAGPLDPAVQKAIVKKTEDKNPFMQVASLFVLGKISNLFDPEIYNKSIEKKLADKNPFVVQIAAVLILEKRKSSNPTIWEKILAKLEEENFYANVQSLAFSIFDKVITSEKKDKNVIKLKDESFDANVQNTPEKKTRKGDIETEVLQDDLFDRPTTYKIARFIFKEKLGDIRGFKQERFELVAEKLDDGNPIVQIISLFILQKMKPSDLAIQEKIIQKREDKNPIVQKAAETVLKDMGLNF